MPKNKKLKKYVNHPIYGSEPIPSADKVAADVINGAHWRYRHLQHFPETAIIADISKQNYAVYPRGVYVDIEEICEVCGRAFIFFAREQKHWFEDLGFWIDAHCTKCVECRKKDREIRLMQKRYQELVGLRKRSASESRELKKISLELYQLGYIRDVNKINSQTDC